MIVCSVTWVADLMVFNNGEFGSIVFVCRESDYSGPEHHGAVLQSRRDFSRCPVNGRALRWRSNGMIGDRGNVTLFI